MEKNTKNNESPKNQRVAHGTAVGGVFGVMFCLLAVDDFTARIAFGAALGTPSRATTSK